ncbi:unnamed protein product [Cylindrotheca closterium]|uniref:PDZ domain-containing protein n=1 Tax=Cylindrotheca closterium TaxID=2856 RepID=A0AAD2FYN3_9STRA|nr:unnamed protein product [Cylindrotheca closterium]
MSGKFPSPPPLATSETIGSKSGFQVEFREGYYYIAAVPPDCKDLKVGDRVLEINGVKAFNFGSTTTANELFDTVCMVFLPKEELMKKQNGTSSDEKSLSRRGRRSVYEEEARRAGAERISSRNLGETLRKEKEEEDEIRHMEREIRQLQKADRERRADKERRRSQILSSFALPNGELKLGERPSLLFSPPQTSSKRILQSSIMESIKRSPSTSDRKKSQIRNAISVPSTPMTSEQPKKTKEQKSKERKSSSLSPTPFTTRIDSTPEQPKKAKEQKTKQRKSSSVSPAPQSKIDPSTSEPPKKAKEPKTKEPKTDIASAAPSKPEVPKNPRPREPMSPNPNSDAPKMPIRRSSVMVERKVRELERAARARNGGNISEPLSPEENMKPKVRIPSKVLDRKLSKSSSGGSKKWSSESS